MTPKNLELSARYQTITGLVKHYSPTGQVDRAADWFVTHMKKLGFTQSYRDDFGNPTGVMGSGPNQIVFLGHIDTVPGEIPVVIRGNDLYGRGSVDAKGPLAAFADAIASSGEIDGWQLIVIGAIDEEGDSHAARFLLDGYQPQYVIIGEPSDWRRVTIGYKGSLCSTLTLSQELTHSASQVSTSCENAFLVWQKIRDWANGFNQLHQRSFDQVAPSLVAINSDHDGLTEWTKLEIITRLPNHLSPQQWELQLLEIVKGMQVKVAIAPDPIPACLVSKNTPLVRAFLQAIRSQAAQPGFVLKTGTSDMNIVAPVWNCPILAYGPGDSSLDHTPEEHVNLEEYNRAVSVLQTVIQTLTKA